MASPQIEKGYTRIANELMDALVSADLSKRQLKVVLYVIRKTYGFNKKVDVMSNGEIARATGLDRRNVVKVLAELAGIGVITLSKSGVQVRGGEISKVGINKDYEAWATSVTATPVTSVKTTPVEPPPLVSKQPPTSVTATPVTSVKTTTHKRQEKDNTKDKALRAYRPEGVSAQTWDDFIAHRKGVKKPMTEEAAKRLAKKLDGLSAAGESPEAVLDQSIVNGWQGVFPVKQQQPAAPKRKSLAEQMEER